MVTKTCQQISSDPKYLVPKISSACAHLEEKVVLGVFLFQPMQLLNPVQFAALDCFVQDKRLIQEKH